MTEGFFNGLLDSDVLFVVSNLVKGIFEEARTGRGSVKQCIVLTHNIYFHKEISFSKSRDGRGTALSDETFWIVKKLGGRSRLERFDCNPIRTSYELLWAELKSQTISSSSIQNTMRKIIENYFKIMGNISADDLVSDFDGKERQICHSLMSWVNDGSHYASDDLYIACDDSTVERYLDVFRRIFEKANHIAHYNMMMGIAG